MSCAGINTFGEVHIRGKAEYKHSKNSHPAETWDGARRRSTSLLGCTTSHMRVPCAKRRRDHACRRGNTGLHCAETWNP